MGAMLIYQYRREMNYRMDSINSQLMLINRYVIDAYERDADLTPILDFLKKYLEDSMYDDVRVSIYNANGNLVDYIGAPIPRMFNGKDPANELLDNKQLQQYQEKPHSTSRLFYYSAAKSDDGKLYVRTGLPNTVNVSDSMSVAKGLWVFSIVVGLVCTLIVFFATRKISRNIILLHHFVTRAASGQEIDQTYQFPHDELGDISRQVVNLYKSRSEAVVQVEREHEIAMSAVEEKARIKNQLTNNINHELKTPIGIIKGYIDTILTDRDNMPDATKYKFLERAQANVDRLCGLLNDVSTMTRLEEGGEKIPVGEVDFHDLVFQLKNDFNSAYPDSKMTFSYNVPIGCKVKGNSNVLTSLLSNLIRNAMMHSRGTEMSLSLLGQTKDFYSFSFADNGIGVPPESIPHLFERFYRVDNGRSRKAGGSGLGLPIVRNVIMVLGGAISAKNRSTGGLEFIFTLPRWKEED